MSLTAPKRHLPLRTHCRKSQVSHRVGIQCDFDAVGQILLLWPSRMPHLWQARLSIGAPMISAPGARRIFPQDASGLYGAIPPMQHADAPCS